MKLLDTLLGNLVFLYRCEALLKLGPLPRQLIQSVVAIARVLQALLAD